MKIPVKSSSKPKHSIIKIWPLNEIGEQVPPPSYAVITDEEPPVIKKIFTSFEEASAYKEELDKNHGLDY